MSAVPVAAADAAVSAGAPVVLRGVTKTFRSRRGAVEALAPVDLDIAPGELVVLIGPSGCGKTTLLRTIGGLVDPSAGTVEVGGRSPSQARRAKQFGLVPQSPTLLPWRTVRENVALLAEVNRRAPGAAPLDGARVDELLAAVGLDGFADARPRELSGGMQQRVSLVRAFALGAPILLMDEPFAALDEITRAGMRELLLQLWGRHRPTVLFTTHSLEEAVLLADRVLVMGRRPGRIVREQRVALPRPHVEGIEDSDEFGAHVRALRASLTEAMA